VTPVSGFVAVAWPRRTKARLRRIAVLALMFGGNLAFGIGASAQQSKPEEYQVKAVYLYNFGRFIEWPTAASADELFTICVLGRDPFGAVLDTTLAGETINNRKLAAKRISSLRDAAGCRILFVSSSESGRTREILNAVEKSWVLTVSDMPNFTNYGGMIQFVLRDNKVRFEVNLGAAEKAGLSFSSQLLKVATDIRNEPRRADVNR
jgi:YfiR/HmsC-like